MTVNATAGRRQPSSASDLLPARRWLIVVEATNEDPVPVVESTVSHAIEAATWCQGQRRYDPPVGQAESGPGPSDLLIDMITAGPGPVTLPPSGSDDDAVVLIGSGCRLEERALAAMVNLIIGNPRIDLIYGDSILESSDGSRPELRPGYSPDRLAGQSYLGGVMAVRRRLWDVVVDRRSAEPVALTGHRRVMALSRAARAVAHIPRPLYRHSATGTEPPHRPQPVTADESSVSVIIPTNGTRRRVRGRDVCLVHQAVASIIDRRGRAGGSSPAPELVVVTTPGIGDTVVAELRQLVAAHGDDRIANLRIVHDDRPFNFSNACNRGAVMAGGDVLVFLNDDTEIIAADWLHRLVAWTSDPTIGAVGARLYYEDGTIQHNGLWTRGGHPTHRYEGREAHDRGHLGSLTVAQNCLAVTGACLAVRAELFHRVGGFSPVFPSSYNDVDLCLKLLDHGYRTVIDPAIELFHFEASSRDPSISGEEMAVLHDRWRGVLNHDPFDNPNFDAPGSEELPLPIVDDLAVLHDHEVERPPVRVWPLESLVMA